MVTLKLVSAAAGNALFYGSEGETSDECAEPSTLLSQVVQQTTVGFAPGLKSEGQNGPGRHARRIDSAVHARKYRLEKDPF